MTAASVKNVSWNWGMFLAMWALVPQLHASVSAESPASPHAKNWLVVRLVAPLTARDAASVLSLETGYASLDTLIAEARVTKIEHALALSMRNPKRPEALRRHGLDRTYRIHVPAGADVRDWVTRFGALPEVEYAELDYLEYAGSVLPDDPVFGDQWGLDQPSDADVDAPEAWDGTTGANVILALPDTGVDTDHEDLAGKLVPGYDFVNDDSDPEDDRGHGTRVASILAANTNNGVGIAGVCWDCLILPIKVKDENGQGTHTLTADGWVFAVDRGARIINHSAGSASGSQTLLSAARYAYDAGVVIISGAGNGNGSVTYPAAYDEVIAAGGTNSLDQRAVPWTCSGSNGSNFGPEIDVVAPADWIPVAEMGGGYSHRCGNSFAAPHVAGLVGLIHSVYPSVGREETRHLLRSGAEDQVGDATDTPGFDIYYGWGRINADRTLEAVRSTMSLQVTGKSVATTLSFETGNPLATSYDFVRGDLTALAESDAGVRLGSVTCLEDDSPDPATIGDEDTEQPAPGQGFFYLGRFNGVPGAGSYGGSSQNRDRTPSAGDCAK